MTCDRKSARRHSRRGFLGQPLTAAAAGALAAPWVTSSAGADEASLPRQLQDVNTTDIKDAIRLGCRTMQTVFNADDPHRVPFFGAGMRPPALSFSAHHSESHTPGRHLNALLNAEDGAGIELDEAAVKLHAQAAFFSYSGPLPLPLNRARLDGKLPVFSQSGGRGSDSYFLSAKGPGVGSPRPHPRPIRVRMRGDAVTAMENFNSSLTFFPPLEE